MRSLDSVILYADCRLDKSECDTFEDVPEYDVTQQILKIGINEIIDEYLDKLKAIIKSVDIKESRSIEHMYGSTDISSYIYKVFAAFADANFNFELNSINHIFAGLEKFDEIMYEIVFESIRSTLLYMVTITIVGIIIIGITIIISYRVIITTNETLNELVNVIFLIPQSTVNMIPQFKRFIETGSFEEQ
ncbi:hypothetical protein BCR32DRAFT_19092 [Anaeromyces robustus]|uniref:Uncharacterized protein n=1 Tax=Anaeromyces robustus TaxID=1754192 RepID=A0A1Y1X4G0_9FUNG|nr:hypothetical protein BCR32DRAFT_19092 [Anaeromyces robustus]|eukprot:ORX80700.1 hypothetical protein BCR32DRAFT_19092 [Anaeromyces robustus]